LAPTTLIALSSSHVSGGVGDHRLPDDLDRALAEPVLVYEALRGDDRRRRPVGGGGALEPGERVVDQLRVLDLLQRVLLLELGVRVAGRVLVVLPADPGVVVGLGAVALHVLAAGHPEHHRSGRRALELAQLAELDEVAHRRLLAVVEDDA